MKSVSLKILAAALCLALLCGCAAENNAVGNNEAPGSDIHQNETAGTPGGNDLTPDDETPGDTDNGVPDESGEGDASSVGSAALSGEELDEWTSFFLAKENNGLLRFPYSNLEDDPNQLAPYLVWLFYDIGEPESELTDEELARLSETDLWLELDTSRLTRSFITDYLADKLNIPAELTGELLAEAELGVYLAEFDAWYMSHGDTEYSFYEIDRGERYEDGTIKLYYANDFLRVMQDNGEMDYINAAMVITMMQEDGRWYVASHEILQ